MIMLVGMRTGATHNRNVMHTVRWLEEHGAVVGEILHGKKHITIRFTTREGVPSLARVSLGPVDPLKLRNYARQAISRAPMHADNRRR